MKRTEIAELGEFGLIERLKKYETHQHASTLKGIGDDAAVWKIDEERYGLLSTDLLAEGIHFDLGYTPLKHLGYKAIVVNVSDIVAMNGYPKRAVVSIALSNRFSVEAIEELYEGMKIACERYRVDLVGGDTTSSRSGLIINVAIEGEVSAQRIAYRHTARVHDVLCVTGDLGAAYIGLQIMEREKQVFLANPEQQPDLTPYDYVVERLLRPEARLDMVEEFRKREVIPTAMIDISDGLASEILHLCTQSNTGVLVYEERIPIDRMTYEVAVNEFKIAPTICAMNGGEDYELLFALSPSDFEKVKDHPDIVPIGYLTHPSEGTYLQTRGGKLVKIEAQGWNHFKKS